MIDIEICQQARLTRDPRFDGSFFTAVKTTKIYCRSICPVNAPKEKNICYFPSAIAAAQAGFRPCLRCRPDSAPGSPAWKGVGATLERSIRLINEGFLEKQSLQQLATYLGISDRYLRQLFVKGLGVSPKKFALYQQCLFAKQLLHQIKISVTEIALASGFGSVRRFNDCIQKQLNLTPLQIRKSHKNHSNSLKLKLYYRPPYNWKHLHAYLCARCIPKLEWINEKSYGRTFHWGDCTGHFDAEHIEAENRFDVTIELNDIAQLKSVVHNIRRILDLDVDIKTVEECLKNNFSPTLIAQTGLRLPGIWSVFEAGIRAILGQQISVTAACNLVAVLTHNLGDSIDNKKLFPLPEAIAQSPLEFLKIPQSRKQTLRNLAQFYVENEWPDNPEKWLKLKGIGKWTIDYAKLRGLSEPDVFLGGDLGVKKALAQSGKNISPDSAAPWRSYLTFHLWSHL